MGQGNILSPGQGLMNWSTIVLFFLLVGPLTCRLGHQYGNTDLSVLSDLCDVAWLVTDTSDRVAVSVESPTAEGSSLGGSSSLSVGFVSKAGTSS